jgi:hypothetical protein
VDPLATLVVGLISPLAHENLLADPRGAYGYRPAPG